MRQLIALLVSLLILGVLWWQVDVQALWQAAQATNPSWLAASVVALAPLLLVSAQRFRLLSRTPISLSIALRLVLSAATLNLFLPSKMGDLAKSWVLVRQHGFKTELALSIVVLERILDLAALIFWGLAALLWTGIGNPWLTAVLSGMLAVLLLLLLPLRLMTIGLSVLAVRLPGRARRIVFRFVVHWGAVRTWFWSEPKRATVTLLVSLALWGGHLLQFWLLARAVGYVPLVDSMAFATISILAGLLPFTMAGVGTRDTAIVLLFQAWLAPGQGAMLGLLSTLRYIVPALAGLPFVHDFWTAARTREQLK